MTAVLPDDEEASDHLVPGYKNYLIHADESGTLTRLPYYGFGMLWLPYERRGDFYDAIRRLKIQHDKSVEHEVKWTKTNRGTVRLYRSLVDYVLDTRNLFFHAMVVPRRLVNVAKFHKGSWPLCYRKQFGGFLHKRIGIFNDATHERVFHVRVDKYADDYVHAAEVAHKILNAKLKNDPNVKHPLVESFLEVDSRKSVGVQLCDLLLGLVMAARQGEATNREKLALMAHVARRLGWKDLNCFTYPNELSFNIWCWRPPEGKQLPGLGPRVVPASFGRIYAGGR